MSVVGSVVSCKQARIRNPPSPIRTMSTLAPVHCRSYATTDFVFQKTKVPTLQKGHGVCIQNGSANPREAWP